MLLTLTTLLMSCRTLPKETNNTPDFPEPYDVNGELVVELNVQERTVTMPIWYWKKIVEYAVEVQGVEE